jgi:hypothetical protein
MSGAIPPLPQYAFIACCSFKAQGQLYLLPLPLICYCIIHQENLCAVKSLKMNVVTVVPKLVNFVRSNGMNHRQFKDYLSGMESE